MNFLHERGELCVGALRRLVNHRLLVQGICGLVELVDGLATARSRPTEGSVVVIGLGGTRRHALRLQQHEIVLQARRLLAARGGSAYGLGAILVNIVRGVDLEAVGCVLVGHKGLVVGGRRDIIGALLALLLLQVELFSLVGGARHRGTRPIERMRGRGMCTQLNGSTCREGEGRGGVW